MFVSPVLQQTLEVYGQNNKNKGREGGGIGCGGDYDDGDDDYYGDDNGVDDNGGDDNGGDGDW